MPYVDPIVIPPVTITGYQPGEVEPFTQACTLFAYIIMHSTDKVLLALCAQTTYRSVFAKADRKYNSSQLATCDQGHFTIRVVNCATGTRAHVRVHNLLRGGGRSTITTGHVRDTRRSCGAP